MRALLLAAALGTILTSCDDAGTPASGVAGRWKGTGGMLIDPYNGETLGPTLPTVALFEELQVREDGSGGIVIDNALLPFTDPLPLKPIGGGYLLASTLELSRPPPACDQAYCPGGTDVLHVTGVSAGVTDGKLVVGVAAWRVTCCTRANVSLTFVGTR